MKPTNVLKTLHACGGRRARTQELNSSLLIASQLAPQQRKPQGGNSPENPRYQRQRGTLPTQVAVFSRTPALLRCGNVTGLGFILRFWSGATEHTEFARGRGNLYSWSFL